MEPEQQSGEPPRAKPAAPDQRPPPPTSPAPPPAVPPSAPPSVPPAAGGRRAWSPLRRALVILAGALALLCLGGLGVGFLVYDQATKPDRSAPDVAVDNYLRALLVDRDDTQARMFACSDANLDAIVSLRGEVERRERDFDVKVQVVWSGLSRTGAGKDQELVGTDVTIAGFADGVQRSRRTERWEFRVVDDGGWRVCGARRLS